ncbi:hypothetical protein H6G06_04495 [Anabaena sphaerica FACHB-251]|uniref:Uncharacterized protein n=1 Tax=Anabaena sphaerica FACHB-251 TaxID=2692883 RepID=A0A926ZYL5_9NOST|nr:hypothetical protein [Anabaena sphaerica]MBD2292762.1 hypothetical protein [Anabaena sphaerica FACHB-251]
MNNLMTSLTTGELNLFTGLVLLLIATGFSMLGGAIGGIILAGKDFGYSFSATIGGLFGPTAAIPAILLGLCLLTIMTNS